MAIHALEDRAQFMGCATAWDALAASGGHEGPFFQHRFIRIWLDNFASDARWRVLCHRDGAGALQAVLPLVKRRTRWWGLPVREWSSASNPHSCRFDVLARDAEPAAAGFLATLDAEKDWDVLRLGDVPNGGRSWAIAHRAMVEGYPVGAWESLRSPYLTLPASFDALLSTLSPKFRANLRRRRKKLEAKGRVELECYRGGADLDARLEEAFRLEASGWKGTRGSAIAQDAATRGFYAELAREAAHDGELRLYFLRVNDRPLAFHFGLCRAGRYSLLKPGYDESLGDCSPGQLLTEEVMHACIDEGLVEFDFLGPDMPWKRDWTQTVRVHNWLYVFRRTRRARALHAAKFRWAPKAREALIRWQHGEA